MSAHASGGRRDLDDTMQFLGAPTTLELPAMETLRLSLLVHNESDEDAVCFIAPSGLEAFADVEFEPALGFIEARSTARFEGRIRRVEGEAPGMRGSTAVEWLLFCDGTLHDRSVCLVTMEPPREVRAEVVGTSTVRLENVGARNESLSIRVAPGFGGDVLVASGPFELAPGESCEVPLYVGSGDTGSQRLGLLVVGGPEPLLLQVDVRPEIGLSILPGPPARVAQRRSRGRRRGDVNPVGRTVAAAAGTAMAAGLALALALGGHLPVIPSFFGVNASVAATKLDVDPRVVAATSVSSPLPNPVLPRTIVNVRREATAYFERAAAAFAAERARHAAIAARKAEQRAQAPAVVALSVPDHAGSGSYVRVRYATKRASQVEVLAKVGPIVVADQITSETNGTITLPVPHTQKWVKLMSVRVQAERDGGHTTKSATIAILPPDNLPRIAAPASEQISLR